MKAKRKTSEGQSGATTILRRYLSLFILLPLSFCLFVPALAEGAIADTVHNLSVTGPGTIKAAGVGELCIFCHTPHRASQTYALWNRDIPPVTYNLYSSTTLEATLKQPVGASRLCLSCHDGTTALGSLRVSPATGPVSSYGVVFR